MQTLSEIKALLSERGLRPRRRFGQNFLHDKNQLTKLIEAANVRPGDLILEVGPGTGTLTEALLERGAEVIASEIDRDLAAIVRERLGERIALIEGDALERGRKLNAQIIRAINNRPFKLVANLPYQIASPLMAALLIDHAPQDDQTTAHGETDEMERTTHGPSSVPPCLRGSICVGQFVTIQKEVADRLLAQPGTKEYGPLTVIVRAFADVKKIATLKPASFWPPPKVTSAMVAIVPHKPPGDSPGWKWKEGDRESFARFITDLFSRRRKQLGATFGRERAAAMLPERVTPDSRPEALTVDELMLLWRAAGEP